MNTHVAPPPSKMTAEQFEAFIQDRPREERWQLIDGEPFLMMSPATINHNVIAKNLVRLLDDALEQHRPDLMAVHELGLKTSLAPDYRPMADVAVLNGAFENAVYAERFYCAAEVLSDSNTRENISRKRELYSNAPECLYVLIIAQDDFAVEVWSRADGWKGHVFRSADDVIELPEFGFSCRVAELYRGVQMN